jgi:hypothetical protein
MKFYNCKLCPNRYSTYSSLLQHHKTIHKRIRYGCGSCKFNCTRTSYVLSHQRKMKNLYLSHSGLRYVCGECEGRYENETDLDLHRLSIHLISPISPPPSPSSELKNHLDTFHYQRYECKSCGVNFSTIGNLYQHQYHRRDHHLTNLHPPLLSEKPEQQKQWYIVIIEVGIQLVLYFFRSLNDFGYFSNSVLAHPVMIENEPIPVVDEKFSIRMAVIL